MTNGTKRHIDNARQILVGVVPNPTSQIDQITTALIYKFMDDMDQASVVHGGEPSFFIGNLKKYAWSELMKPGTGNQEKMNMYTEALNKFTESKQLPPLFREIFKSAFLPYKNPEVLGLFLQEINYFDYSHPEELGNAYEYLLSIMSSQGDAGQFRTPRHIIDFMVDVVDPTKDDNILDPACGTGGFLVSSYKHILEKHDGKNDPKKKEKPLTPEQRKNIFSNFEGYDVDPGMVRIAMVNMYLHHFKNPKIYNYNTLSEEEHWGEKFSVMLANPPFMSPKGGVSTHNKFSIPSNRSEVLFVNYIMTHLKPKGRAGIIVPEGIIFQSATAHTKLRKALVEDGLYAVISLPSGVFQPYSGVKTSILFFNNALAPSVKEILFFRVDNDGLDLGATKRPIEKNDLPQAIEILKKWEKGQKVDSPNVIYVKKTKIAEDGDYSLSGGRYATIKKEIAGKWKIQELGEMEKRKDLEFLRGSGLSKKAIEKDGKNKCILYGELYTKYQPIIKTVESRTNETGRVISKTGDLLIPGTTTADAMGIAIARSLNENGVVIGGDINIIRTKNKAILSDYLSWLINYQLKEDLAKYARGTNIIHLSNTDIKRLRIPVPPIEVQEQVNKELSLCADIINGAQQIIQNWKPTIEIDPNWKKVKLKEVCEITSSKRIFQEEYVNSGVPFYRTKEIVELNQGRDISIELFISEKRYEEIKKDFSIPQKGDILLSAVGTIGISWIIPDNRKFYFKDGNLLWLRNFKKVESDFVKLMLDFVVSSNLHLITNGAAYNALTIMKLKELEIPIPPTEIQEKIIERIGFERTIIQGNKKLIEIYEQKIKNTISKLWGQ